MTAEPRDVEEIRADIARQRHREVLARLAAADRENAELRREVERLRSVMHDWAGDMGSAAGRVELLEACLEAVRAATEALRLDVIGKRGYPLRALDHLDALRAALSAAPQPEPDDGCAECTESGTRNCVAGCKPEPPASEEPTGRSD